MRSRPVGRLQRPIYWLLIVSLVLSLAAPLFPPAAAPAQAADVEMYLVTVSSSPSDGGSVSPGSGTYGGNKTFTATPAAGYQFVSWTVNGTTKTGNPLTIDVTKDTTLVANFQEAFGVTVSSNPVEGGTVDPGSGSYAGTKTFTATPAGGYQLVDWTVNGVKKTGNPISVNVNEAKTVVANFIAVYDVAVGAGPGGSVTPESGTYGGSQTFTATPDKDFVFDKWTVNGVEMTGNPLTIDITENTTIVASFKDGYNVTVTSEPWWCGKVTPGSGKYGGPTEFTATANDGYLFAGWTVDGVNQGSANPITLDVTASTNVVARFDRLTSVVVSSSPSEGGSVSPGSGDYIGEKTFTATPAPGYQFVNWTVDGVTRTDNPLTLNIAGTTNIVANFQTDGGLSVAVDPFWAGSVEVADGRVGYEALLMASPNSGYAFTGWTVDGVEMSGNPLALMITGPTLVVAHFEEVFSVTTSANPAEGGSVSPASGPMSGPVEFTATPADGYEFTGWTINGNPAGTENPVNISVTANATVVANFRAVYSVTVSRNPYWAGSVTPGSGNYNGEQTFTASPASGYVFVNWTIDGVTGETTNPLTMNGPDSHTIVANFKPSYAVTVNTNPTEGGTVDNPSGIYPWGDNTFTAAANPGYLFKDWTVNGQTVGGNPLTVNVTGATDITANFVQMYPVTVTVNNGSMGTVSPGSTDYVGTTTFTAIPKPGYAFAGWLVNGVPASGNPLTLDVQAAMTVTANFVPAFAVTVGVNDPLMGTVSPESGEYAGETTFTATPEVGYEFIDWTVDGVHVLDNPLLLNVTAAHTIQANFQLRLYDVTVAAVPAEGGSVNPPSGRYRGTDSFIATANPGYRFDGWLVNGEASAEAGNALTIDIAADTSVEALFVQTVSMAISSNNEAWGTVDPSGTATYDLGEPVSVTATPALGYRVARWTWNGVNLNELGNQTTVTYNAGAGTLQAVFELDVYFVNVSASPVAGGTVDKTTGSLPAGSNTFTATPNEGYRFLNWTVNGQDAGNANPATFDIQEDTVVQANFVPMPWVTKGSNNLDWGFVVENGGYYYGSSTFTAQAQPGHRFLHWEINGVAGETANPVTIDITEDTLIIAIFEQIPYDVTIESSPLAGGTVDLSSGIYYYGLQTLTATPAPGYQFKDWTVNGVTHTDNPLTVGISADTTIVANFTKPVDITVDVNEATFGSVDVASGSYDAGSMTFTATPTAGHGFVNWTVNGQTRTDNPLTIDVQENTTITANFGITYHVTPSASPAEGGSVQEPEGDYVGFSTVYPTRMYTWNAIPADGWAFEGWTLNGTPAVGNPLTGYIVADTNLVAVFKQVYPVSVSVNDDAMGYVDKVSGEYGGNTNFEATAYYGYRLKNWMVDGVDSGNANPLTVDIQKETTVQAVFEQITYDITVSASPEWCGSVTPGTGKHAPGTVFTATPAQGYRFASWNVDGVIVEGDNHLTLGLGPQSSITANFEPMTYAVDVTSSPAEGGSVTPGSGNYLGKMTFTATANEGYQFVNWTVDGQTVPTNPLVGTVQADTTIVANFVRVHQVTFNIEPLGAGTIDKPSGLYAEGPITFTATANPGYEFVEWREDDGSSPINPITGDLKYDLTVTAVFKAVYPVSVDVNDVSMGSVDVASGNYGGDTTFTATPEPGRRFVNWTINGVTGETTNPLTLDIQSATILTANFEEITYPVVVSVDPAGAGSVSVPSGDYYGMTTFSATANPGYQFKGWDVNGVLFSENPVTVAITEATTITASFERVYYVTVNVEPAGAGSVNMPSGEYASPQTFTATANPGYEFIGWDLGGPQSLDNPLIITFNTDATLTARFKAVYPVTVDVNDGTMGSVDVSSGSYGGDTNFTATPEPGYRFVDWTINDVTGETANPLTLNIQQPTDVIANFELITYDVTIGVNPLDAGTVDVPSGRYVGDLTLEATAAPGYEFVNWFVNGVPMAGNPLSINIAADTTIAANFQAIFPVTVSVDPVDGGTVDFATGEYNGTQTLTATPENGFEFVNWTVNGVEQADNPLTINVDQPYNVVAHFRTIHYVQVGVSPEWAGSVDVPTGRYGGSKTFTATPNDGYAFQNWTISTPEKKDLAAGQLLTANPLTIDIDDDIKVTANFVLVTPVMLISPQAGEALKSGENYMIRWQSPIDAVKFTLEYTLDKGATWQTLATDLTGSGYLWDVPVVGSNLKGKIRVTGYNSTGEVVGIHTTENFKIHVLKVTSPNGNNVFKSGSQVNVTWQTHQTLLPVEKVQIFYSLNGGATWARAGVVQGNPGVFKWTVPFVRNTINTCLVKVVLKTATGVKIANDESNAFFTINPR